MAFQAINDSEIEVGKPTKKELWKKVQNSLNAHEEQINALTVGASPVEVFNFDIVNVSSSATLTGVCHHKAFTAFTVSTVEVQIFEKGIITTGILEIDIKKNTSLDDIGMTSILSTKPSINFAVAPDFTSASGVLNPVLQEVNAGEFLRLDVTSLPTIPLGKFRVVVYGVI
jgi:hypothetical protein